MDILEIKGKQLEVMELLKLLSIELLNNKELEKLEKFLVSIYSNEGFRHSYSEITTYIVECADLGDSEKIETLTTNLTNLKDIVAEKDEYEDLFHAFFKLWDHVSLEVARISIYNDSKASSADLLKSIENAKKSLDDIHEKYGGEKLETVIDDVHKSREALKTANKSAEKLQTQVVSILGIFSAIIIAFFGGLSYLGNALNNINAVSKFRLAFMVAVIGLIVINLVFVLLYYISKMIEKPIKSACENDSCDECRGIKGKGKCHRLIRVAKRYPYIFWINILLIFFCIGVFIVWMFSNWIVLPLQ